MSTDRNTRRTFVKTVVAVSLVQAAPLLMARRAAAQELPRLTEDDPTATALGYVHDASKTANPRYQAGQTCANCQHLQGEAGQEWRPCAIFPGKAVAAAGWCSVWVQKAG